MMPGNLPALRVLAPNRREVLRLGGLAGLGLALPTAASGAGSFGRAKSVLVVFASGGQSQLETWDPKPDAPAEIRGAFGSIPTATPGLRFCEHLPSVAARSRQFALVRTLSHDDLDHGTAIYLSLTGTPHAQKSGNPPPAPTDSPAVGAILKRVRPASRFPHPAVHVNGPVLIPELPSPGQFGGLLGRGYDPLLIGDARYDPLLGEGLSPVPELPPVRQRGRQSLLAALEYHLHQAEADPDRLERDRLFRQAYELLADPRHRAALDLNREPAAVRERYGLDRGGQACLLGRRLIEAGVPLVTVFLNHSIRGQDKLPDDGEAYGWDTHNDIFAALKDHLLPRFDHTFSALLDDLGQRGLLDSTLVVCLGEFGRAPRVAREKNFAGSSPGRKHWAAAYSAVFAGAGVTPGSVIGSTDRHAAYPATPPYGPWDVAATILHALGIDPAGHYYDHRQRPYALTTGRPIAALYG